MSPVIPAAGRLLAATILAAALVGCGGKANPSVGHADAKVPVGEAKAEAARLARERPGRVRLRDEMLPAAPVIIHNPRMDLATSCRLKRDAADSVLVTLCFDEKTQDAAAIETIRVETWPGGARGGLAIQVMAAHDESAHFLVERKGAIYQLLDAGFPVRRDGAYRRGEVRVVAMGPGGAEALVRSLQELLPRATVQRVDYDPPPPPKPVETPSPDAGTASPDAEGG